MKKKDAINLFVNNQAKYKINDIKKITKIHCGYTNLSYLFEMNDQNKFQVRIAKNNEIVDRTNEKKVLSLINESNYIYLDNNGNAIKKWIKGRTLKKNDINNSFLKALLKKINNLHIVDIKKSEILFQKYDDVLNNLKINKKYLKMYNSFLNILKTNKWVLSHNDLNFNNILINNNELFFIDYEWARINHPLWDIVNFIRESRLKKEYILFIANELKVSYEIMYKMLYICYCFSQDWALNNKLTWKILIYRIKNLYFMHKLYKKMYKN